MTKVRIIIRPDDTVAIIHPAPNARKGVYLPTNGWKERLALVGFLKEEGETNESYAKRAIEDGHINILEYTLHQESDADFLDRVYQKVIKRINPDEPSELEGLPFMDINTSELPDRANRDKWRMKPTDSKPKIDHSIITAKEKRQSIENQLDVEIAKGEAAANIFKITALQRQLQTGKF
jgi:hypothetical protein